MDRSVLEGDPHRVLEAMAIAGYAVGARKGFIYCRAEYPAGDQAHPARDQPGARKAGFLGKNLFETDFSFDIEIRVGAGAFVCGEETALLASIEGKRGIPRPRPPFPAVSGLWGKPTLISNVETYACILPDHHARRRVVRQHRHGEEQGHQGLCSGWQDPEHRPGGGADGHHPARDCLRHWRWRAQRQEFKAAQTGGPSGGCIPAEHIDNSMDYESLAKMAPSSARAA